MMKKAKSLAARSAAIFIIIGIVWSFFGIVELWDGAFTQVEFQVSFIDKERKPIKGVTLSVTDSTEALAFGYPVTDYKEESVPCSNDDGLMLFHHVNLGLEFGGKCRWLFFAIPIGKCEAPKYTLHFWLNNKEVGNYQYNKYLGIENPDWDSLPTVKRPSAEIGSTPESLPYHLRPENRHVDSTLEYYVLARTLVVDP